MIWLTDVDLSRTHKLRYVLNNSKADYNELLPQFEIPVIASVLRLYLLELPGSFCQVFQLLVRLITEQTPWFPHKFTKS
jgi:hypothetical protein